MSRELTSRYGVIDNWPVFSEAFRQWVIEDDFVEGRPDWGAVGVQFVDDVAPYEFMKLRLLNASHLAVAGLGGLTGYTFIDETMRDSRLRRYMQALMDRETGSHAVAGPRHRSAKLQGDTGRALREPDDQGHGRAREHRRAPQPAR